MEWTWLKVRSLLVKEEMPMMSVILLIGNRIKKTERPIIWY